MYYLKSVPSKFLIRYSPEAGRDLQSRPFVFMNNLSETDLKSYGPKPSGLQIRKGQINERRFSNLSPFQVCSIAIQRGEILHSPSPPSIACIPDDKPVNLSSFFLLPFAFCLLPFAFCLLPFASSTSLRSHCPLYHSGQQNAAFHPDLQPSGSCPGK